MYEQNSAGTLDPHAHSSKVQVKQDKVWNEKGHSLPVFTMQAFEDALLWVSSSLFSNFFQPGCYFSMFCARECVSNKLWKQFLCATQRTNPIKAH